MSNYQLLTCNIALAGDIQQIVARNAFNPITYPELIVLSFLHGETAITDVFECGYTEDREPRIERERLMHIYGKVVHEHLFPGHNIQMPVSTDRYKPRLIGTLVNPGNGDAIPPDAPIEIDPDIVEAAARISIAPEQVRAQEQAQAARARAR
jgi:hypothetical protein